VRGQVGARAIGVVLGLQATLHAFLVSRAFRELGRPRRPTRLRADRRSQHRVVRTPGRRQPGGAGPRRAARRRRSLVPLPPVAQVGRRLAGRPSSPARRPRRRGSRPGPGPAGWCAGPADAPGRPVTAVSGTGTGSARRSETHMNPLDQPGMPPSGLADLGGAGPVLGTATWTTAPR
jgi:hypothetical protein